MRLRLLKNKTPLQSLFLFLRYIKWRSLLYHFDRNFFSFQHPLSEAIKLCLTLFNTSNQLQTRELNSPFAAVNSLNLSIKIWLWSGMKRNEEWSAQVNVIEIDRIKLRTRLKPLTPCPFLSPDYHTSFLTTQEVAFAPFFAPYFVLSPEL